VKQADFLDRDGALIEDIHLFTAPSDIRIMKDVPDALRQLKEYYFFLIIISNQTVVVRGLGNREGST